MAFKKGDRLTEYDGNVFYDKTEMKDIYPQTHVTQCEDLYVNGLDNPDKGRGMGSFSNHSLQSNAEKVLFDNGRRVLLRATKDIVAKAPARGGPGGRHVCPVFTCPHGN